MTVFAARGTFPINFESDFNLVALWDYGVVTIAQPNLVQIDYGVLWGNDIVNFSGRNITYSEARITGGIISRIETFWGGTSAYVIDNLNVNAVTLQNWVLLGQSDRAKESILSGSDLIHATNYADNIQGFSGNDILWAYGGNDVVIGGDGDDILYGGLGADHLDGGDGNDSYLVDNAADTVVDSAGTDTIVASLSWSLEAHPEIENLILEGGASAIGSAAANTLIGHAGANVLVGFAGDDLLEGGSGDDLIDGGAGNDAAVYAGSRNAFHVRSYLEDGRWTTAVADATGAEGTDFLVGVEMLSFGGELLVTAGIQQNAVSNVDGGAVNDVLFLNETSGQIGYVDMSAAGAGGFVTLVGAMPAGWRVGATGDLSGDGRAEAVVQDPTSGSIYTVQQGRGWAEVATDLSAGWTLLGAGDFTGDGLPDPLVQDTGGRLMVLEVEAGGGVGGRPVVADIGTGWRVAGIGDPDRDGHSDVVIQSLADGTTWYADIDGGVLTGWGVVSGAVGPHWVAEGVADVAGDGYDDVIFRHQATGQIWGVDMLGGTNAGWFVVTGTAGTGWQVAGTLDHDNDGHGDVLVRQADGTTYALDIDNGGFAGWDPITGTMGSDWVLV